VVKSTRISLGSAVRFSMRVLQASIERNELAMLGKQNILKVAIANPTGDTLTYQVVIQAENTLRIEDVQLQTMGVVKSIAYTPFAEPSSWLIPVPPDGASYSLAFTSAAMVNGSTRAMFRISRTAFLQARNTRLSTGLRTRDS